TDQSPETGPSLSPGPGQGVALTGNVPGAGASSRSRGGQTGAHPSGSTGPSLSPGPGQGAVVTASTSMSLLSLALLAGLGSFVRPADSRIPQGRTSANARSRRARIGTRSLPHQSADRSPTASA